MTYRMQPIPSSVVAQARLTMKAPGYGHPIHAEVAKGYGPCRSCLRPFAENRDRRLLFTYDPFHDLDPFPLPGPVYVHEAPCRPYDDPHVFPDALRFIPMTLNGYAKDRRLVDAVRVPPEGPIDAALESLFERADVRYVHLRNTEAGCFLFSAVRARGVGAR